jgi:hypothetical protein
MKIKPGVAHLLASFKLAHPEANVSPVGFKLRNLHAFEQVPDRGRFVRCLPPARYICDSGGAWPPDWNPDAAERHEVAATICELAAIELEDDDEHGFNTRMRIARALMRGEA